MNSLDQREFALNSSASSANVIYLFKAYDNNGSSVRVLDYNGTEDAMLEIWEYDSGAGIPVLRAGIKNINQSSSSVHDSQIALERMWAKPGYSFSTYRYYTFVMRGLVKRPYSATSAIPDDKFSEVKE